MAKSWGKNTTILFVIFCAAFTLLCGLAFSPTVLIVGSDEKTCLSLPIRTGDTFSLRFIHSVHRTPVWENFVVGGPGKVILVSTEYESYGVGMPSLPSEGTFALKDGKFILTDLHRTFAELPVRAGPEARLTLIYKGKEYPLHEWVEAGTLLRVQIKINYFGFRYPRIQGY